MTWHTLTFSVRVAIKQNGGNFSKSHPPCFDDDFGLNRSQKYSLSGRFSANLWDQTGPHHMTCPLRCWEIPNHSGKHTNKRVATCLFVPVPATLPLIELRHSTIDLVLVFSSVGVELIDFSTCCAFPMEFGTY